MTAPVIPPLPDALVQPYLARVGAVRPAAPTLPALASLHRAHLLAVPFENLDIHLGRPIRLDTDSLWAKVVGARRGGYCYELNGLFAALLRALDYEVDLVSARVALQAGGFTDEFDHLALLVGSDAMDETMLADVGFGASFVEPVPLRDGFERHARGVDEGLVRDGDVWHYRERRTGGTWATQYAFTAAPHTLADFGPRNEWQQNSPDSHFTQRRLVSVLTGTGRVTLSDHRLITTTHGVREERELDDAEVPGALAEHFGIVLD